MQAFRRIIGLQTTKAKKKEKNSTYNISGHDRARSAKKKNWTTTAQKKNQHSLLECSTT